MIQHSSSSQVAYRKNQATNDPSPETDLHRTTSDAGLSGANIAQSTSSFTHVENRTAILYPTPLAGCLDDAQSSEQDVDSVAQFTKSE